MSAARSHARRSAKVRVVVGVVILAATGAVIAAAAGSGGVLLGVYPALRAARLAPTNTLRSA